MYELLDHYLDLPQHRWPEKLKAFKASRQAAAVKTLQAPSSKPARIGPSLPVVRYTGQFNDPWYGTINVRQDSGQLTVDFPHSPGMIAKLEHHQYDTFRTVFADKGIEPAYVTFNLDSQGKVDRITMKAISPIADFSWDYHDLLFTPVASTTGR
jgi:hypothetical protein